MLRWTTEEEKYLIENYKTSNYTDLSQILSRSEGAIRAKCFELKLVKNDRWTDDEINYLLSSYHLIATKEIAEKLNRTPTSVGIKAKKMGLKKYEYICDYNFFENINTEQKAYWLGFISADGWISTHKESNEGIVGIELQASDIGHLKKFNKDIKGNYKIDIIEKKCNLSTNQDHIFKLCRIRIYSKKMVDDLIALGLNSDKSHSLSLPQIPMELMKHYLRGYFDGDGCVRARTRKLANNDIKKYPVCDITSKCINFLETLRTYLYNSNKICSYIYPDKDDIGRLYIHKNEHTLNFLNLIYGDATVYLTRKYKIYQNIIDHTDCLAN